MPLMTTRRSPIESLKLFTDYSREEFERSYEFIKKVKEIDEEQNHRGIFTQYVTAIELYRSGSLDMVEVKNRVTTIFKNCDVLLDGFHRIMKDSELDSRRDHIVGLKRMVEFLKALRGESERLRLGFMEAFGRFKEHKDGQVVKEEVDFMLRDYPCLKEEFRLILLENGFVQDEKREEITFDREDEMFEEDMYFHSIESAIKFAAAEEEEGREKKPPAGVYGAMRRLYAQRRRPLPRGFMRDPKLAVRRVLSPLQCKHNKLLKNRGKLLKKVQEVNESLVVFKYT